MVVAVTQDTKWLTAMMSVFKLYSTNHFWDYDKPLSWVETFHPLKCVSQQFKKAHFPTTWAANFNFTAWYILKNPIHIVS